MNPHVDKKKYKNLLLYILERENDINLGKKKLFKLLYFIDFDYYEKHSESITKEVYVTHKFGPIPSGGEEMLRFMAKEGFIQPIKVKKFIYEQHRFIPQEKANVSVFNGEELEHIDATINKFKDDDGASIEAKAKADIPFLATKESGEKIIDYDLVFYRVPSSALLSDEQENETIVKSKSLQAYLERLSSV